MKAVSLFIMFFAMPFAQGSVPTFRVVIDPGHGGNDTGTVFDNGIVRISEKDATLLIARQVAKQLKAKGIGVTLTRQEDRDLSLGARTALANRLGADVFLSIHMNSTHSRAPKLGPVAEGIETYILNNATDATSKRLARLENSVIQHTEGESPQEADVALILRDLRLDANLGESKRLACAIQDGLSTPGHPSRLRNRGVKQALFHVLLGADMPSVLVEAGFLTSARDRAAVLSPKRRKAMAASIAGAIDRFRKQKGTPQEQASLSRCKVN